MTLGKPQPYIPQPDLTQRHSPQRPIQQGHMPQPYAPENVRVHAPVHTPPTQAPVHAPQRRAEPMSDDPPVLTRYQGYMRAGLLTLVILVFGVGFWAMTAKIQGAVIANGAFVIEGKPKIIQHLGGGIIDQVHVQNADHVKQGDLLLTLNSTLVNAKIQELNQQDFVAHTQIARLNAERQNLNEIRWHRIVNANRSRPEVRSLMLDQTELFEVRRDLFKGRLDQIESSVNQNLAEIDGIRSTLRSKDFQLRSLNEELQRLRILLNSNAISSQRVTSSERQGVSLMSEIDVLNAKITRLSEQNAEAQAKRVQLKREREQQILTALSDQKSRFIGVQAEMASLSDRNIRSEIRAPSDGIVHNMRYTTVNGVVPSGQEIMQIIPVSDQLLVEARVSATDIDQVRIGQTTEVSLSAFHVSKVPQLTGTVLTISADLLSDDISSQPYYSVLIGFSKEELDALGSINIIKGMPADSFIQTEERSVMNYLLRPISRALGRSFREE